MRITSGNARGLLLDSPRGESTRPATDAARQAVFSSLGNSIVGAKVLDLFAGTGAYGLEALSRGAKSAIFVEKDRRALLCLNKNVLQIGRALGDVSMKVLPIDAFKLKQDSFPDIIFADPPYDVFGSHGLTQRLLELLTRLSSDETSIILEAPAEFELPENSGFEQSGRLGKKSKGKPTQIILRRKAAIA